MYVDQSRRFSDSYCLQRVINKGTQATVWEATSLSIDDDNVYAVKIFDKSSLTTSWDQTQLKSEIFFLQEFDHPHIIRLMDVFEDASSCYVVTERLHGDLFDRIVRKTHYSERDGRDVSRILCKAVVHCHVHTTAHRDLKPENLLLVSEYDDKQIKLADFGFATIAKNEACLRQKCGTPGYIAPEILRGDLYGTKADMWSLGVIVYTLLGGYLPFNVYEDQKGSTNAELFDLILSGQFEFHEKYWREVSDDAKDFISSLLVVDPLHRLSAHEALNHPWISTSDDTTLGAIDLAENLNGLRRFNAKRKLRQAVMSVIAVNRVSWFAYNNFYQENFDTGMDTSHLED